jgi:hypothetical protein
MKLNQHNKFVRFILRVIDVVVSFRFGRRVRWKEEPFRKATNFEWRLGWSIVAFIPILFLLMAAFDKPVDSFLNNAEHHSVIWLYIGFVGMCLFMLFFVFILGQKFQCIFQFL